MTKVSIITQWHGLDVAVKVDRDRLPPPEVFAPYAAMLLDASRRVLDVLAAELASGVVLGPELQAANRDISNIYVACWVVTGVLPASNSDLSRLAEPI